MGLNMPAGLPWLCTRITLLPFALLLAATLAVLLPASSATPAGCLFTDTHCACEKAVNASMCLRHVPDSDPLMCIETPCKLGWHCDCLGTSVCTHEGIPRYVAVPGAAGGSGGKIACQLSTVPGRGVWLVTPTPTPMPTPTPTPMATPTMTLTPTPSATTTPSPVPLGSGTCPGASTVVCSDFVLVELNGAPQACVRPVPVVNDVDEAYGYRNSRATKRDGLLHDYANIRFVHDTTKDESDGSDVNQRRATCDLRTKCSAAPLTWLIKDDPIDVYTPPISGMTLQAVHEWVSQLGDGFCVGSLSVDDGGMTLDFSKMSLLHGLNYQSYDAATSTTVNVGQWTFANDQVGGTGGAIDEWGRKTWGGSITGLTVRGVCECP
ncbi:hypothetical protein MMPV_003795 [Pyropia vietnamensis]